MPVHFCKGDSKNKIGFVLSTPGKAECKAERPASGETGDNMNAILKILNTSDPVNFPSTNRYYYLITNASTKVMYAAKDNGKTEDLDSNITDKGNLDRIRREVADCVIVILCGDKAHLLATYLNGKSIIKMPHPSNKGLRTKYNNDTPNLRGISNGKDRDLARLKLCADSISSQVSLPIKAARMRL